MVNVCQKCGDRGYSWLLVSCTGCNKFVEHQYCLDELPKDDEENIQWLCEECEPCNTKFIGDEESNMPNDDALPQNLGTYLFRDRAKHSRNISNDEDIVGGRKLVNGRTSTEACVSEKKKHKLSLPLKPRKHSFNREISDVSIKVDTYLFRNREKHSKQIPVSNTILSSRKSLHKKLKLASDIPSTNVANVSEKNKELHVPPLEHLGLKTWGSYKRRVLNRGKSSIETPSTSSKDHVALHDHHDLDGDNPVGARTPTLDRESEENIVHHDSLVHVYNNTEERDGQPKEGELRVFVERGGANSRKRESEITRVDAKGRSPAILQPIKDKAEPTSEFYYISAWPIVNFSWRGFFKVGGKSYGPFNAHLSTKACEKAWNVTKSLSPVVHFSLVSRSYAWPKSIDVSPPTDDHIALFFFPCYSWVQQMVEPQLQEIIRGDLVLKVGMDDAELLVLPSTLLPRDYQKFEDKFYLWGTYKSRKPNSSEPAVNKQDEPVAINQVSMSCQPLKTKTTKLKSQQKHIEEEEIERSHLTDESDDDLELADSANKRSRKNELDLFPTQVENIALRSKLGEGKRGLDLELGLSLPFTQ